MVILVNIAKCAEGYPAMPLLKQAEMVLKSEVLKDNTKLEVQAAATKTVEPINVTEDPLDKDFTTVSSKFMDEIAVKVELRKAAAPSENTTLAMWEDLLPNSDRV